MSSAGSSASSTVSSGAGSSGTTSSVCASSTRRKPSVIRPSSFTSWYHSNPGGASLSGIGVILASGVSVVAASISGAACCSGSI